MEFLLKIDHFLNNVYDLNQICDIIDGKMEMHNDFY